MTTKQIGQICFNTGDIVSESSTKASTIYAGTMDNGRKVIAVKRVVDCMTSLDKFKILSKDTQHENVIRYLHAEKEEPFIYIALEWCLGTLKDFVENSNFDRGGLTDIEVVRQIANGLVHVHSSGIFHLDLKPSNVLITRESECMNRVVISDFDISKCSEGGRSLRTMTLCGTEGWFPPEVSLIKDLYRYSSKVDMFAFGCLMYYVMTKGLHPFYEESDFDNRACQKNISLYSKDEYTVTLQGLDKTTRVSHEADDLVFQLLEISPEQRPCALTCLAHPVFWDHSKQRTFVQASGDILYGKTDDWGLRFSRRLDKDSQRVIGDQWHVGDQFETVAPTPEKYDKSAVSALLRFLRDYDTHMWQWKINCQVNSPAFDGLLEVVNTRYPGFILHVYYAAVPWRHNNKLKEFYPKDDSYIKKWDDLNSTKLVKDMHCVWKSVSEIQITNIEHGTDFRGVAIDNQGRLVVTESTQHSVYILVEGRLTPFLDANIFGKPSDIAIDNKGNIAIADPRKNAVFIFDKEGRHFTTIQRAGGQDLNEPNGVAFNPSGKLVICDTRNHRVAIFSKNKFEFESAFGERGSRENQLQFPWMVAADENNLVYISDAGNHRIQVFTIAGQPYRTIGKRGVGACRFIEPTGVALFEDCLLVTDLKNKRVQVLTRSGKYVGSLGPELGNNTSAFSHVWGVGCKKFTECTIFVADRSRVIQITLIVKRATRKVAISHDDDESSEQSNCFED